MASLSIVIPLYNEAENLPQLHAELCKSVAGLTDPVEFLMIDDGSTDGTRTVLRRLAQDDARLRVVGLRRNFGQTAALQAGIDEASGEILVFLDGDLQNDPADIPNLVAKLADGYDLVCGWRKQRKDLWLTRRFPSQIANWLISRVTRVPIHDLGCTLKAIRRELAEELKLVGDMHRFIPILAHRRGARCAEIATNHRPRIHGKSKYGLSRIFRVLLDLITVKFLLDYFASPIKFFGTLGLGCWGLGLLSLAATLVMKWSLRMDMTGNPLLLFSVLAVMAGLQLISLGVLGEINIRIYYDVGKNRPYAIAEIIGGNPAMRSLRLAG